MCIRCRAAETDISKGITKMHVLESCKKCTRYFLPPRKWMHLKTQSDILSFIFVRYKEIRDLEILHTEFKPTEEHSKRLILSVEIKKDDIVGVIDIVFKLRNKQCGDCDKVEAKQFWTSIVQVRQRAVCKRTLLYLEQAVLKHRMYDSCTNIKERKDGIDFYFLDRKGPVKMVAFLENHIGSKVRKSSRLLTEDRNNNHMKYKFSYSVEIFPLCRDDLVVVDESFAKKRCVGRLLLVIRVTTRITLIDPFTARKIEVTKAQFWAEKDQFRVVLSSKDLQLFTITDVEREYGQNCTKSGSTDCFVTRDQETAMHVKTHLVVAENEKVYGYDLGNSNQHFIDRDYFKALLVRKYRDDLKFKVKTEKERDREYRFFLEDLLEDSEMRKDVDVYDQTDQIIDDFTNFQL